MTRSPERVVEGTWRVNGGARRSVHCVSPSPAVLMSTTPSKYSADFPEMKAHLSANASFLSMLWFSVIVLGRETRFGVHEIAFG